MCSLSIVVIYLFLQMSFMWGLYRILKNPSVVDVSWSLGLMVSGLIYLSFTPFSFRTLIISSLLILWALRLAFYLWYTRIRKGHVDKRYIELSTNWKISPSLGFFINFQLQGLLILIISSVFLLVSKSGHTHITTIDIFAFCVITLGVMGETIADLQLQRFKIRYKGEVCNRGLWNYSRHPNYFFDWLSWMGFALFAIQSNIGYLGLLSPLMLYIVFTRMTGPLTERGSMQSRGQKYIEYQKQTSMFFPWFKKKSGSE
jgi:steroid 5-alpha reductase family enzyme